jgi:tetratricopeptide (TPR) repeat protein
MRFNKSIFFTLFPTGYWIVIALGILLNFLHEVSQLGNLLINIGVFLLAVKGAVIIHETGHLMAAKAVGGRPRRIVLGNGHELYRTNIFNIRVVINSAFLGGHAYALFEEPRFLKLRYAAFILGGVLFNVACALLINLFFEIDFTYPMSNVAIPFAIFLANIMMVFNFIPYYTTIGGMKVPTDGLALLKLPFTNVGEIEKRIDANGLWEGYELLENKDYESAWKVFNQYREKYPDTKILSMHVSLILLKTGRTEESLKEILKLLDHLDDEQVKGYTGLIYNQIAWTYLVLNDIEQADHYSVLAIKAVPHENYIRGTRGSVLIEKGTINEGMNLLFHNMDFQFVNNGTLSSAVYLMLAYHLKGDAAESMKYSNFIQMNEARLELDEKLLYKRNSDRIPPSTTI